MELTFIVKRFNCIYITLAFILIPTTASQKICRDREPIEASFHMIPEFRTEPMDIKKDNEILMYGNKSCKKIRKRATRRNKLIPFCPSFYVLNFDSNRFPMFVAEAHCACRSCGDNSANVCIPLYYYREILEYSEQRECYTKSIKQFQIGCQCVKSLRQKSRKPKPPP